MVARGFANKLRGSGYARLKDDFEDGRRRPPTCQFHFSEIEPLYAYRVLRPHTPLNVHW